jgi:hypothetical protein
MFSFENFKINSCLKRELSEFRENTHLDFEGKKWEGSSMNKISEINDATAVAAQLGRLDLVSLLLAAIGLILVLGGLFAFFNFRSIAKAQATNEATKVAEEVAERVANEYLQKELPDVIKAYRDMVDSEDVSDDLADKMAEAQEDVEGDDK